MATDDTQAQEALAATNAAENQVETQVETEAKEEVTEAEETAEVQEDGNSEKQPEDDAERPRNRSGLQRMKSRLAQAEAELAQLRGQPKAAGVDVDAMIAKRLGEPPKESDYNGDYLAFSEDMQAYKAAKFIEKANVSREIEQDRAKADILRREAQYDHEERIKAAEQRIPDFAQVIRNAKDVRISDQVSELIVESDKSAELLYTLAKNPDIADELNGLSPIQAAKRLGQIEARLTTPQPKKATGAQAPNTAVRGGAAPPSVWSGFEAWERKTYPHKYR